MVAHRLVDRAEHVESGYSGDSERPLGSYAGALAVYGAAVTAAGIAAHAVSTNIRKRKEISEGIARSEKTTEEVDRP